MLETVLGDGIDQLSHSLLVTSPQEGSFDSRPIVRGGGDQRDDRFERVVIVAVNSEDGRQCQYAHQQADGESAARDSVARESGESLNRRHP